MGDPQVDEARFLMSGDHIDWKAKRAFRFGEKGGRVARDTKRIGGDGADRGCAKAGETFGKPPETAERRTARLRSQVSASIDAGTEAKRFPLRIETIDLFAFDTPHLESEAVRPHVDDRECSRGRVHAMIDER